METVGARPWIVRARSRILGVRTGIIGGRVLVVAVMDSQMRMRLALLITAASRG